MPLTREELIQKQLGEIIGELKTVAQQNDRQQETLESIRGMFYRLSTDVSAIRSTQAHHGQSLTGLGNRVDTLEKRVGQQEVVAARHGAGFGALAAAGTALIVEAFRQWIGR